MSFCVSPRGIIYNSNATYAVAPLVRHIKRKFPLYYTTVQLESRERGSRALRKLLIRSFVIPIIAQLDSGSEILVERARARERERESERERERTMSR